MQRSYVDKVQSDRSFDADTELAPAEADKLRSEEERLAFFDRLANNPHVGDVIPGSGGCRKVRWSAPAQAAEVRARNERATSGPRDDVEPNELAQAIVGIWSLGSFTARSEDGQELKPWGESPMGKLIYHESGQMAVIMSQPDRPRFRSPRPFEGTSEEVRAAFENLEAYAGRFELGPDPGVVTHHVEVCRMPNWEGQPQVRHFEISGDRLVLRTPMIQVEGKQWVFSFTWARQN